MKFIPADLPAVPAGTEYPDLPETLERQCCPGKSCGTITVTKRMSAVVVDDRAELRYSYVRCSNENDFYGPFKTVDELVAAVNDTDRWPGVWVANNVNEALYYAIRFVEDAHLDGQARNPHTSYPLIDTYKESTVTESETEFVITPPQKWMGAVVIDRVTGTIGFREQPDTTTGSVAGPE